MSRMIVFCLMANMAFSLELRALKYQKVEAVFQSTDFFKGEFSSPLFTLLFPKSPESLEEAPFPLYGTADERGMEFLVAVFSVKKLLKEFPFLTVSDVDTGRLLDAWLKKGKQTGSAFKVSKRAVKNFPFEAFDLLFCTPEGLAIRARLIRTPEYYYALCTRVRDPLYTKDLLDKKTEEYNLYRKDYRRSKEYFSSLQLK